MLAALVLVLPLSAADFNAEVTGISGGDTLTVRHEQQQIRIRLDGVDAPEKAQAFGNVARQYATELAFGQFVTVPVIDYDRYGRTVAEAAAK